MKKADEWTPDQLRMDRALYVLEQIDSPDARKVLKWLAGGAPGGRQTEIAKSAVERFTRRDNVVMPKWFAPERLPAPRLAK